MDKVYQNNRNVQQATTKDDSWWALVLLFFTVKGRFDWKTYTIAETARQYLSHMLRNLGWPPRSHNFIVTFPLVTFLILNPTVGIISSLKPPVCKETCLPVINIMHQPSSIWAIPKRMTDTYSNDIHKWCFPSILEPYQGKLHLLLEEEAEDVRK